MNANRLSKVLGISTFGESHGKAIGILFDDVIPNRDFPLEQIKTALAKRRPRVKGTSSRIEEDEIEILSGVWEGKTTGMPICILIYNHDIRSDDYEKLAELFRPGHADYAWFQKYHVYDFRGGGRASGRETVARVLAAEMYRDTIPQVRFSYNCTQIGCLRSDSIDTFATPSMENPYCWMDSKGLDHLHQYLKQIQDEGDSVGAILNVRVENVSAGWGDPVYEKLDANIAKAMLSIGSIKGIHFGRGLAIAETLGSDVNDRLTPESISSTFLGGINGGVSNGAPITFSLIIRPPASVAVEQNTIARNGHADQLKIGGRHDLCHLPRLIPIVEAMLIISLAEAAKYQSILCGKAIELKDLRESIDKVDEDLILCLYRRKQLVNKVKELKKASKIPFFDPQREADIDHNARAFATKLELDPEVLSEIILRAIRISR